ncbi:hypothetical protein BDR04DRAFT_662819 [Suillus decipiens]|nr:hypothetical protein BDR04DRAFT_662819 [Suillus decipiens]
MWSDAISFGTCHRPLVYDVDMLSSALVYFFCCLFVFIPLVYSQYSLRTLLLPRIPWIYCIPYELYYLNEN